MSKRSSDAFKERNQMAAYYEDRIARVRAAREAVWENEPHRKPRVHIDYARPETGSRSCIADPDCTRPVARNGMCRRHNAIQEAHR